MIQIVEITRIEDNPQYGTFGVLTLNKEAFCVTLEPYDINNSINISCIPTGQYMCDRFISPKFGETFRILNVPGRSHILFHPGNTVDDTAGCIILGQYFGKLKGARGVMKSAVAFKMFMESLPGKFHLTIRECL